MAKSFDGEKIQWDFFIREWGDAFENARHILHILRKETRKLASLEMGELIDPDHMEALQRDWIRLCGMLETPMERNFFKPWWIPLEKNSLDLFMDLSNEQYPVFRAAFFFVKPYRWYKETVLEDISSFLLADERGTDLEELNRRNEAAARQQVDRFFRERKSLAFNGELEVRPPDRDELLPGKEDGFQVDKDFNVDYHSVRGIGPLAIGLLPFDLPVTLKEISVRQGSGPSETEGVKCIRDLVYLLRNAGSRRISSYFVETRGERVGSFAYLENELCIMNRDRELVKSFFNRLSAEV